MVSGQMPERPLSSSYTNCGLTLELTIDANLIFGAKRRWEYLRGCPPEVAVPHMTS
jgi:hypothetical protein